MPTNRGGGIRGGPGVLGIPGKRFGQPFYGDPMFLTVGVRPFRSRSFSTKAFSITGVTRDSTGAPLGGCAVDLYFTNTDQRIMGTTSDGSGNFSFPATAGPYYLVAYKSGSPDVAGTTINTLTGV